MRRALLIFVLIVLALGSTAQAENPDPAAPESGFENPYHFSTQGAVKPEKTSRLGNAAGIVGADLTPTSDLAGRTLRGSLYFFAVLLLGVAIVKKFRSKMVTNDESVIEVISRKNLSPRSSLLMIRVQGNTFLLSQNGDAVTFLTQVDDFGQFQAGSSETDVIHLQDAVHG